MPKDSYRYFNYFMEKKNMGSDKNQVRPNPPLCVGAFGYGWGTFKHKRN